MLWHYGLVYRALTGFWGGGKKYSNGDSAMPWVHREFARCAICVQATFSRSKKSQKKRHHTHHKNHYNIEELPKLKSITISDHFYRSLPFPSGADEVPAHALFFCCIARSKWNGFVETASIIYPSVEISRTYPQRFRKPLFECTTSTFKYPLRLTSDACNTRKANTKLSNRRLSSRPFIMFDSFVVPSKLYYHEQQ
jgi:hypothetical protein